MSRVEITALGLAAVKISDGEKSIYIDAFIREHHIDPFDYRDANLIIVTHDHGDHFHAEATAAAAMASGAVVIGPPSIAYPLLAGCALPIEKLRILYHQDPHTPVAVNLEGICISSYSSPHFFDGDNMTIHNSYLIEFGGGRIYLTGDSSMITQKDKRLFDLDALLYNFVAFDKDLAKVSALEQVMATFAPRNLFPVHIVDCDWTVRPEDLKQEIARRGLSGVVILDKGKPSRAI